MSTIAAPPSPYKGLAPFDESPLDALLFFGREREIEVIVANLMAARLTILFGASGVGKTSLLRAGVVHRLRSAQGALVAVVSAWTGDPIEEVLDAVEAAAGGEVAPPGRRGALADVLAAWTRRLDADLYVILDQFEEYFLYHEGERGAGTLADELPEAVRRAGLRANFLIGIREDSLAALDALKPRIPNLFANSLRLERLDRVAARAAILGPLERYNELAASPESVTADPELVGELLDQVAVGRVDLGQTGRGGVDDADADRIEAPYLQLVLERLWEVERERGSRRLRLSTLAELGGAARIVEDHLERAMDTLSPQEKDAAAAIYNHLVTPSGTKIAHRARDLAGYAAVDELEAQRVLHRLVEERIVRAGEDGAAGPRYEIFHDVLADAVLAWRTRYEAERRLEQERRTAARRHRRLLIFSIAALVLIAILAAAAVFAFAQRHNARAEARRARARELAARALTAAPVAPEEAVRLALAATDYDHSDAAADVLRRTLRSLRTKAILRAGGPVTDVDFSPDGTLVAAASQDGYVRIYRASDGRKVASLRHGAAVVAAVFSPDGSRLVTAGADRFARVWDVSSWKLRHRLRHGGPVTSVAFSKDGSLLATGSEDRDARVWDARSGRLIQTFAHPAAVRSVSLDKDGSLLVTALVPEAADRLARVWDVSSGLLRERLVQGKPVTAARFDPTGSVIVTAGGDHVARVWDAATGALLYELAGHQNGIFDARFSPSGGLLVTASADETARVWNMRNGHLYGVLPNHQNYVVRAVFSPDGRDVATASRDRIARIFEPDGTLRATLVGHRQAVVDVALSEDGESVATASGDGTARLWDRRPQPDLLPLGQHRRGEVAGVAFAQKDRRVVSVASDGSVRAWRLDRPRPPVVNFRLGRAPAAVAVSRDGRLAAAATSAGFVRVRAVATGRTVGRFRPRVAPVALAFSWDGDRVAVVGRDRRVRVWRLGGGIERTLGRDVVAAAFSPDGSRIATAGRDGVAHVWDLSTGKEALSPLVGHTARLTNVAFSPDGRYVATTSRDHDARVWDAHTGRSVWTFGHTAVVSGAAFSGDSRWLVTAGPTSAVVWELSTGRRLYGLNARDHLLSVAFSAQGWVIAAGGANGGVKTYECRLCGGVHDLETVARERLANLRR